MATQVTQANYWTLSLSSNTAPVYNFKFVVEIWDKEANVKITTLLQPKNAAGSAHLDFEKIVKNYITVTHKHSHIGEGVWVYKSIHYSPLFDTDYPDNPSLEDVPLSRNSGSYKSFKFRFFEEYSTTPTGAVTRTSGITHNDLIIGKINWADGWSDLKDFNEADYAMSGSGWDKKLLTNLPSKTDNHNDTAGLIPHATNVKSNTTLPVFTKTYYNQKIWYKFYAESPVEGKVGSSSYLKNYVGQIQIDLTDTYGGSATTSRTDEDKLIFIPSGANNLLSLVYESVGGYRMGSEVVYYTIEIGNSFSDINYSDVGDIKRGDVVTIVSSNNVDWTQYGAANNNTGTEFYCNTDGSNIVGSDSFKIRRSLSASEPYLFEIKRGAIHKPITLGWKNKFGAWDYFCFEGVTTNKDVIKRNTKYKKDAGTWNAADFDLNQWDRGSINNIKGSRQTTINTNYIPEEYNEFFQGLLMSNEVVIVGEPVYSTPEDSERVTPINILNSSLTYKTSLKDKLVQYTFSFEHAHDLKTII